MVYREPAEELVRRAAEAAAATGPLAKIDVSGRDGGAAQNGAGGRSGVGSGEHGSLGGDAGAPDRGEVGGNILLVLEPAAGTNADHVAHLFGEVKTDRGVAQQDAEVDFDRAGDIELVARGGRGGDGGAGGRGGSGARGRRGNNASSVMSGSNGGPGGDGGDGGHGSSGAPGGAGGTIVVRVRDTDTHLLMLLARNVRGGEGGQAGRNGSGGEGGPGGAGGSGYSWTESQSYTDAQGHSQTRTVSHHKSGGSSGRAGRRGRDGNAELRNGAPGSDGSFTIEVLDAAARPTKYPSRYEVRLVSLRHRNDNDDGIYEPEERIFVSHVEVENVGGMPTPAHHDVRIGLIDDGWVAPTEVRLKLPRSLAPGQRHVFAGEELAFDLRVFRPQESARPLQAETFIHLFADLPAARRRFADFESANTRHMSRLVVRFPVEASPLVSLFSLAPGQAARIRWSITNVSTRAIGRESELGRAVSIYLGLATGSGLGPQLLHFIDDAGQRVPLDIGFRREVPRIEPGQTIAFEGTIAIDETAKTYTSARLFLAAELGHIAEPSAVRPIQYQEVSVTVGRPFAAQDADVLFVANNRSTGDEIAAWEDIAKSVGLSSAVWDASLEGGIGVLDAVLSGERRYQLVVFLNNTMDTSTGERRASVLVDKATSLGLARIGTHVLYVGRSPGLDDLVIPSDESASATATLIGETTNAELLAACDDEPIGGDGVTFDVRHVYAWPPSIAKEQHLEQRARSLAAALEARWPDRRYIVVPRWAPKLLKTVAWIRVMHLGQLVVRRTTDPARTALSCLQVDAPEMHAPAFVNDVRTVAAAICALPFEGKLALLAATPLPYGALRARLEGGCEDAIVAAVLGDLVREQELVVAYGRRASKDRLAATMPMLAAFARGAFPGRVDVASDSGRRLVEVCAWLELVARGHARWWEWIPPLAWLRRGTGMRAFCRRVIASVLARAAGAEKGALVDALRDAITTRRRQLDEAWHERKRRLHAPVTAAAFALEQLAAHEEGRRVETDAGSIGRDQRVVAAARIDELGEKERARSGRSSEVVAAAAKARGELGRVERCAELLAGARGRADAGAGAEEARVRVAEAAVGDWAGLREDDGEGDERKRRG